MHEDRSAATQSPARLLHLLAVIAAITNHATDVDDALPQALEEICHFAGWPVGQACLISPDGRTSHHAWYVDDAYRRSTPGVGLGEAAGNDTLVLRVLSTGEPSVVEDLGADPALATAVDAIGAGLRSAIAVPVRVGDEIVAVMGFYSNDPIGSDTNLFELLQTAGVQLVRMIERARAKEVIEAERTRQRLFFEASSDAVLIGDIDGRITEANSAAAQLLGRPVDQLIGMNAADFVAPEWADVVNRQVEAKRQGETNSTRYESVIVDFAGNRIPVEVTSTALRVGDHVVGIHALVRDLREHRRSERALRESEERFRGAFDAAPIGMALASPDGRWLKVNHALCELVGYTEGELLTIRFQDITHPDDLAADMALGVRLLAGEFSWYQMEKRYIRKDGSVLWIHLSVSLVRDDDGTPAYSVAQILDIDERKRRELEAEEFRLQHPSAGALSPREREVLGLLAHGKTSAEVGVDLGVAEETVQTHVRRAMAKLDARSRTQAVASAIRLGWLPDDHPVAT